MSNKDTILTGSGCLIGCLRPGLFTIEGTNFESDYTGGGYTKSTYARGTYVSGFEAIEYLEMHSQSL